MVGDCGVPVQLPLLQLGERAAAVRTVMLAAVLFVHLGWLMSEAVRWGARFGALGRSEGEVGAQLHLCTCATQYVL